MRCTSVFLVTLGLLVVLSPFAAAQDFGGFGPGLPSDVLRVQPEQPYLDGPALPQPPPEVHLLLGRRQPVQRSAARPLIDQIFPSHITRFYTLPEREYPRQFIKRHRRKR